MREPWVTIVSFDNLVDASEAQAALEHRGITTVMFHSGLGSVYPMPGGIEIKIHPEHIEQARLILSGSEALDA